MTTSNSTSTFRLAATFTTQDGSRRYTARIVEELNSDIAWADADDILTDIAYGVAAEALGDDDLDFMHSDLVEV